MSKDFYEYKLLLRQLSIIKCLRIYQNVLKLMIVPYYLFDVVSRILLNTIFQHFLLLVSMRWERHVSMNENSKFPQNGTSILKTSIKLIKYDKLTLCYKNRFFRYRKNRNIKIPSGLLRTQVNTT